MFEMSFYLFIPDHMSIGALGDSFYEYLLKAWLQSGREDQEARQMFDDAMQPIIKHMLRVSRGGLTYFSDMKFERLEHKMDHLGCFIGNLSSVGYIIDIYICRYIEYHHVEVRLYSIQSTSST